MAKEQYMADIIGFGHTVDIMPRVVEVMAECQYHHDFSPLEVAALVEMAALGRYIPVDTQDRIEGRNLHALLNPVIKHVQTMYRIEQIQSLTASWPNLHFVELSHFEDTGICDEARQLADRFLAPAALQPFPLRGCRHDRCSCTYTTKTRKHLIREGRDPSL